MKKLTIILDQFPDSDLKAFFAQELAISQELITFISPKYDQIENLSERIG